MPRRGLLTGLLASASALSALWLASRVDADLRFPPIELAERIVRLAPGDVATLSIEELGKAGIHLLAAGVIAGMLVAGVALARTRAGQAPARAAVAYGALLAVAGLAGPNRGSASAAVAVAALGALVYALTLRSLATATAPATPADPEGAAITRRRALAIAGGGIVAALGSGLVVGPLVDRARERSRTFALRRPDRPSPAPPRRTIPAVPGQAPELTSAGDHYVVDIDLVDPSLDAESWSLDVAGEVDQAMRLDLQRLQEEYELVEQASVLTCVSNEVGGPLVGSSAWTGVRLADVLERARVRAGAGVVLFRCADGYTSTLRLDQARAADVLLAIGQNGKPLTRAHGFPCRLRIPALYGMKNPKWIERIEVRRAPFRAYWVERGWSDTAVVRTASRIDVAPDARVGNAVWIAGTAWAGTRGIAGVELSFDGGRTWRPAMLQEPRAPNAWTQWAYRFAPSRRGTQSVMCRATDGEGRVQDRRRRRPHPSGATGYHSVDIRVS